MKPKLHFSISWSAVAAASFFAAGPALADRTNGYGVATAAVSRDPYPFVGAAAAYRMGQDGSFAYTRPNDVPSARLNECPSATSNGFTCVALLGGTNSSNYNLTSSTSTLDFTTSVSASDKSLLTSNVASRSNLGTGQLGVDVQTNRKSVV